MQHIIHSRNGALCDIQIGEVAFEEFRAGEVFEVSSLAGNQAVNDTDRLPSPDELFGEVRSDEAGAASDEVSSHSDEVECKR